MLFGLRADLACSSLSKNFDEGVVPTMDVPPTIGAIEEITALYDRLPRLVVGDFNSRHRQMGYGWRRLLVALDLSFDRIYHLPLSFYLLRF